MFVLKTIRSEPFHQHEICCGVSGLFPSIPPLKYELPLCLVAQWDKNN